MTSDQLAAIAAFLSGAGSVLGAWWVLRSERKRMKRDCEERIQALREGIAIGEHHGERR